MTPPAPSFSLAQVESIAKTISNRAEADAAERAAKREDAAARARAAAHNVSPAEAVRHRAEAARTDYTVSGKASVALLDAVQMRTALDTSTGAGLIAEDGRSRIVASTAKPVRLPALVRTEVSETLRVHKSRLTTYTGAANAAADGAVLPELSALQVPDTADVTLGHFGLTATMTRGHLEDGALFERTVNEMFYREFWAGLESWMINAASTGILAAVTPSTLGTDTQIDALSKLVESVQGGGYGFDGGLTVLLHPATLNAIKRQKTSQGQYILDANAGPLSDAILLPCASVAAGTGVVADFRSACTLWMHKAGVQLELGPSHATNFLEGNVTARLSSQVAFRVTQPAAIGVVTGL